MAPLRVSGRGTRAQGMAVAEARWLWRRKWGEADLKSSFLHLKVAPTLPVALVGQKMPGPPHLPALPAS